MIAQARSECLNRAAGTVFGGDAPVSTEATGPCIESTVKITSGKDADANTLIEVPTNRAQSGEQPGVTRSRPRRTSWTSRSPDSPT